MKINLKLAIIIVGGMLSYTTFSQTTTGSLSLDGNNDYVSTSGFVSGLDQVTVMCWVNVANGNSQEKVILGEDIALKLSLTNGKKPNFSISTDGINTYTIVDSPIKATEWHHLTGSYNALTGDMLLYVDGKLEQSLNIGSTNKTLKSSVSGNGNFEIGRLSSNISNTQNFKGEIDEVRVFNVALTEDQIHQMVYQEIENVSGKVRGKIIPKDIVDSKTATILDWDKLIAYYPMNAILSQGLLLDLSNFNRLTIIKNFHSLANQTAPLPFVTAKSGEWGNKQTWVNGDAWNIDDNISDTEWMIVRVKHNITLSDNLKSLGLIVDQNNTLSVTKDVEINNTWYLELNGTIDLQNDAQLIQGTNSDLVTGINGKILRRQQGVANPYWYNYWSSPVGSTASTTLGNDNSSNNNVNNSTFKLSMLKDANGNNIQFTSALDAYDQISTRWLYTMTNGVTMYDWVKINENTALKAGNGYIQKGTKTSGNSKEYIFEGRPNNGTIHLNVADVGGNGSEPQVSMTSYLMGNPYPSALDIEKFLDDNQGVISGTLRLWQQWNGDSHTLSEYSGGYAEVNKMGSVRAFQFNENASVGQENASQNGTLTPTKYLPVGQGFIAEVVSNGVVEFNNSQRVFVKEADADGSYNTGSTFFRVAGSQDQSSKMAKMMIEFMNINGPKVHRELLLGFSEFTTDGFDYGYDSENTIGIQPDDLNLRMGEINMTMQAYSPISDSKVIPLNFKSSGNFQFSIEATQFQNFPDDISVYLRDKVHSTQINLKESKKFTFNATEGEFPDRFEIVFERKETQITLDTKQIDENLDGVKIYFDNNNHSLYVNNLKSDAKTIYIHTINGQTIRAFYNVIGPEMAFGIELNGLSTGVYIASVIDNSYKIRTKNFIFN